MTTPKAKWIVANAMNLPFENEEFDNATSFFSGMYMSHEDKKKVTAFHSKLCAAIFNGEIKDRFVPEISLNN